MSSPRFIFDSEVSFDSLMQELDNYDIDSFLNTLTPYNYQAFYNNTSIHLDSIHQIDDATLEAVLNAYGVIEIDGYLIKIDPVLNKAYVMANTASPTEQRAFERAASDVEICDLPTPTAVFPLDVNLFSLRAANGGDIPSNYFSDPNTDSSSGCEPEPIVGNCCAKKDNDAYPAKSCFFSGSSVGGNGTIKVSYRGFFLRETLKVVFTHGPGPIGYTINYDYSWTVQCSGANQAGNHSPSGNGDNVEIILYRSSKCLGDYSLSASATFQDPCGSTVSTGIASISG